MSAITPQTDVYLLKVPLEIDNENQLTFSNATAQFNYFNGLTGKLALDNFTYQRKDGVIRVPYCVDDLIHYNYVMYRNEGFSTKWFYAYITGMEFINANTTAVSIKTDVFQTWQFDLSYKQTFVEREHVNDDTIGANTVPEDVETGEYVVNQVQDPSFPTDPTKTVDKRVVGFSGKCYVINSIYNPKGGSTKYLYTNVNGVPISGGIWVFESPAAMQNAVIKYSNDGRLDSISQVYMLPRTIFDDNTLVADTLPGVVDPDASLYYQFTGSATSRDYTFTLSKPSKLDGYTPKNNKLFTGQFSFINVTNNTGTTNAYPYEYFSNINNIQFKVKGSASVGGSSITVPVNYKGVSENVVEGIMQGKFPTLSWSGDSYTNWLTQNAVNIGTGIVGDIAGAALGAASGHYLAYSKASKAITQAGAGVGLFNNISSTIGQIYQHSIAPYTSQGNINGGDVLSGDNINTNYAYAMSIKYEFAKKVDDFLSMFGYQVNSVKTPNVTGRTNWNYVKTVGCYIKADIPQDDLQEIKDLFDRGITFWHNPATFRDYSQSNAIVTP